LDSEETTGSSVPVVVLGAGMNAGCEVAVGAAVAVGVGVEEPPLLDGGTGVATAVFVMACVKTFDVLPRPNRMLELEAAASARMLYVKMTEPRGSSVSVPADESPDTSVKALGFAKDNAYDVVTLDVADGFETVTVTEKTVPTTWDVLLALPETDKLLGATTCSVEVVDDVAPPEYWAVTKYS